MFLKNAWYVAAWAEEITRNLQQIVVLSEKICVFRSEAGEFIALEDACPHRKLPLSKGRIKGDTVECGYHGLTFDCAGQCVWAPGQGRIPSNAKVHAYPLHEKYGLVWIWMGNPALADHHDIFEIENYDDPTWGINRGDAMELNCNYLLMCDNLLDPTHVAWVHAGSFGQSATKDTPLRVNKTNDGVIVQRWMLDVEPAPFYKKVIGFDGKCDRLQHYEVRYPSHALVKAIFISQIEFIENLLLKLKQIMDDLSYSREFDSVLYKINEINSEIRSLINSLDFRKEDESHENEA